MDGKASPSPGEEVDIEVGSPPSDENGFHQLHPQPQAGNDVLMMEDMLPASRSPSGLEVRGEREGGGAETEVEGEGSGAGVMSRMRASRRGTTPNRTHAAGGSGSAEGASPDFAADEQDEDMMDVSSQHQHHYAHSHSHSHHSHMHLHAGGGGGVAIAAEMGGVVLADDGDDGVDLDGTVGAKRKR